MGLVADLEDAVVAYLAMFGLVFADAIVPVFPGETTLNTASVAASQGKLDLALVIAAGALGAVLLEAACRENAALLVLGSRGLGGMARVPWGACRSRSSPTPPARSSWSPRPGAVGSATPSTLDLTQQGQVHPEAAAMIRATTTTRMMISVGRRQRGRWPTPRGVMRVALRCTGRERLGAWRP